MKKQRLVTSEQDNEQYEEESESESQEDSVKGKKAKRHKKG